MGSSGRSESAIPILKQRAAAADTTQAQFNLAQALERANHLEESAAQYQQVLKRDPAQAAE